MAQLVARDVWDVDAAGSNPVTPTILALKITFQSLFSLSTAMQILRADRLLSASPFGTILPDKLEFDGSFNCFYGISCTPMI